MTIQSEGSLRVFLRDAWVGYENRQMTRWNLTRLG